MKHKDYKLETVKGLTKGKYHIREIAKKLNINHMMIVRKLRELLEENAVDFVREGKNQSFFLKKTIEAKIYILQAENYALIQTLKKYPKLRSIINKIQKDKRIKLAVLFGSYAKGIAKETSDIDVFIGTSDIKLKRELGMLNSSLNIKIGKLNKDNLLFKEIEKNHIIIKGVELYYEKVGFFSQVT